MNPRRRRAFGCYVIAIGLLPDTRPDPFSVIPNDLKSRFVRALQFVALTEKRPTQAKAARAAGIAVGTVNSWLSRDPALRERAAWAIRQGEIELADLVEEPLSQTDLDALERIEELPEVELARIVVGEVPSQAFMGAAFPPGSDYWVDEYPQWLGRFPRGGTDGQHRAVPSRAFTGRVQGPRALAVVPDETAAPSEGNGQAGGPPEEEREPLPPPAAMDDGIQPDPTLNPTYYLPPSIRATSGKQEPRRHGQRRSR